MDNFKLDTVPSLSLAFLGDAVYAVHVREYLIRNKPYLKPDALHREANKLVSARAQAEALHFLRQSELLTEEEWDIAKKARNKSSATRAKNASIKEYRNASGLEALVGYLALTDNEARITELMAHIIKNGSEVR
ncbi:mini-ribonuclease 3 [Jeotgalicoccus coquinae]|uniref:Mini-ribonuclease 3 n=1 Tax=Jeotgalicoccus coquinae TaxID=709509 RepID=A0A6V7RRR5_9STAP|nr:ribonuclease III domain-containing protein [Jeotgalicoccus coquinae]MBB6423859.1 ribonuclease-3 family protein [Jeotgalicoccus coquinae]GGE24436.1 mini-ribonuclease 3 [Jeotgalicoccus coquinae]CAD2080701.1 Mini-ribonuclease 3 [Jeotgalicoccus coquinae]